MHVVVLGAGSLGSLYGAWAADAGHRVTLVARPAHAAAIRAGGLRVRDLGGEWRTVEVDAVDDVTSVISGDVVLLASKAQDTAALLDGLVFRPAAAWSIQNGAGQAVPLVERFGAAAVGCSSMVGGTMDAPGSVLHTFSGSTYIGPLPTTSPAAVELIEVSMAPAANIVVRPDIVDVMWSKAVLSVAAMGASVLLRLPYHHVFVHAEARELFLDLVTEAAAVATASGGGLVDLPGPLQIASLASLPRAEALDRLGQVGAAMVAAGQTEVRVSMLQSVETQRRLEHEAIFGFLLERAAAAGLDTPLITLLHRVASVLDEIAGE